MADSRSIEHGVQLAAQFIPEGIGQQEREDRLVEWARLSKRAADPSVPADLRKAYGLRARAILKARPRDQVAREHAQLIAKSAIVGGRESDRLREQARRLVEEENPPADRHAGAGVRKAKDDDPIPVFDQAGNLVGVCDPDDITPLGSTGGRPAPQPAAGADVPPPDPGADGQVAKAVSRCQVVVQDQFGKQYITDRPSIRSSGVRKMADDSLVTVTDSAGRQYQVSRAVLQSPEEQARNTGPVRAGGTTGMGAPRMTGPDAALPGDGPQARLRGDVPDRTVIKALNPGWTAVHDWTGKLVGAVKSSNVIASPRPGSVAKSQVSHSHANVYDASRRKVGMARLSHIIPVADLRKAFGTGQARGRAGR